MENSRSPVSVNSDLSATLQWLGTPPHMTVLGPLVDSAGSALSDDALRKYTQVRVHLRAVFDVCKIARGRFATNHGGGRFPSADLTKFGFGSPYESGVVVFQKSKIKNSRGCVKCEVAQSTGSLVVAIQPITAPPLDSTNLSPRRCLSTTNSKK